MNFPQFLEKQYLEWQVKVGRRTIVEFSAYIGVSQPILSMWMNGKKRPGTENIKLLADIFGVEVYDSLSLPRPNPYQERANRVWEFLPEDVQKRIAEEAEQYEAENLLHRTEKSDKRRKTSQT